MAGRRGRRQAARKAGMQLAHARAERDLTIAALAALARLDPSTIYRIENGIQSPILRTQYRIARALGLTPNDIWPDEREKASA